MIFRRPFGDVIRRQLDLFEREQAELLRRCQEAERTYDRADRDDAEELYGDYADLVWEAAGELAALRDHYAAALDEEAAEVYEAEFKRAAVKRFRRIALELES
jgi:hypothetical protein